MKLELSVEEINFILQTIGKLPTETGAWPLLIKIKEQGDEQAKQPTLLEAEPE